MPLSASTQAVVLGVVAIEECDEYARVNEDVCSGQIG